MANDLNDDDVRRLLADPSPDTRALTAEKIATRAAIGDLKAEERALAEDIFRILTKDAEQRVRLALARNLKDMPDLAPDVARALAGDSADAVALPMIQFSSALADEDLIAIVQSRGPTRQAAIAGRASVSEAVSAAIVTHGHRDAVVALVSNPGAEIADGTYGAMLDRYGDDEGVQTPLVHRPKLPLAVAERLVATVSDALKRHLVTHHELPESMATDLVLHAREQATVGLLSGGGAQEGDAEALVAQLHRHGRLTPSIILRALCIGDMMFFEAAMSRLANVPVANAALLIRDRGDRGFRALYGKAGLPGGLYKPFRAAVELVVADEDTRSDADPETLMRRNLERVLTMAEDPSGAIGEESTDYLLTKFNQLAANHPSA